MSLVMEIQVQGSGKSWNLLGNDADADGRCQTSELLPAVTCIYGTSYVSNCKKCSNSFFAISSQHVIVMNIYSSMDAAILLYMWLVTAVRLYI